MTVAELDGVEAFTKQPQAYMLHAAPRMTAIVPARGHAQAPRAASARSLSDQHEFSVRVHQARDRARQPESILVYPALAEVEPKLLQ